MNVVGFDVSLRCSKSGVKVSIQVKLEERFYRSKQVMTNMYRRKRHVGLYPHHQRKDLSERAGKTTREYVQFEEDYRLVELELAGEDGAEVTMRIAQNLRVVSVTL